MASPYEVLGVPKGASDDEIKKAYRSARARVPPGQESGGQRGGGEVQGGTDRLRPPLRSREAKDVRHVRGIGRARFPRWRRRRLGRRALRGVRPRESQRSLRRHVRRRRSPRRARRPTRGDDLETRVRISFEDSLEGVQVRDPRRGGQRLLRLPRNRRRARNLSRRLSAVRGTRSRLGLAGPLRVLAALPALPGQRDDRREAVQELPRLGSGALGRSATP